MLPLSFREKLGGLSSLGRSSTDFVVGVVGEGIGLSLLKAFLRGGFVGVSSIGGGRVCRLPSGLLGTEDDLWRTT